MTRRSDCPVHGIEGAAVFRTETCLCTSEPGDNVFRMPFLRGFVDLPMDPPPPTPIGELREFNVEKNVIALSVSREFMLDMGLVEPTPEERAQRDADLAKYRERVAAERAIPGHPLTLEAVLEALGWSAAFAAHWIHPACHCDPFDDDPSLCDWARDLGFTEIGGDRGA